MRARFAFLTGDSVIRADVDTPQVESIESGYVQHPVDGSLMARVEGSIFLSGPSNVPTWLATYLIDVYPVSNGDYSHFIAATGYHAPRHWVDGTFPADIHDHPVVHVTWNDAQAYAEWVGKSLPTSEQWEKAARGTRGTTYPWGISRRRPSATCGRTESATRPRATATRVALVPTGSMTSAAMCGSGVRRRRSQGGMSSKVALGRARSGGRPRHRSTTPPLVCVTTTPVFAAPVQSTCDSRRTDIDYPT